VTELLEGETLRARMEAGPLPARKAIEYAVPTAEGLAAAHDKGIVHRDLKPENLFLTKDGRVKNLEFGLARQIVAPESENASSPTASYRTEPGTVGTLGYMSPEQVRGKAADHRSDLFSLVAGFWAGCGARCDLHGLAGASTSA
jgi:serine/threonine protein kinase